VVAARCPPLAAAIALLRTAGTDITLASSVEFQVLDTSYKYQILNSQILDTKY
jgi:hypothetical protein